LTSKGITCVLLKYRVPNAGPSWDQLCGCDRNTRSSLPLEDAQRTIGLVRFHAAEWHIDLHKIGVLGFSAGGHLVALVSTHFDRGVYVAVDAADQESFAVALYPGHLFDYAKDSLNADLRVTGKTPARSRTGRSGVRWSSSGGPEGMPVSAGSCIRCSCKQAMRRRA